MSSWTHIMGTTRLIEDALMDMLDILLRQNYNNEECT